MLPYSVQYALSVFDAAAGVVASVLAAAYLTVHPSWLTGDLAATCGVIVPITVGLGQFLPALTRTPQRRDAELVAAAAGALPRDVAAKHPTIVAERR